MELAQLQKTEPLADLSVPDIYAPNV